MVGGPSWAGAIVVAATGMLLLAGCGSGSGSTSSAPAYGKQGPASVKELDACLAAQPEERKLLRSTVNGSLSADLKLVGQGAPTGPLVNTTPIENGKIDGVPAAKEIGSRMKALGNPAAFTPYRSGAFAVYPAPRVKALGDFQATVDACLPVSSADL